MTTRENQSTDIDINPNNLYVFTTEEKVLYYKERLKSGKEVTRKFNSIVAKEYVDFSTGEIISAISARKLGISELNARFIKLQQELVLNNLNKPLREFAKFVLLFRNLRRGITPDIETLCKWYAEYKGLNPKNTKHYIEDIKNSGILASDTLLMPLFQLAGKHTKGSDHLSEDFNAAEVFRNLLKHTEK